VFPIFFNFIVNPDAQGTCPYANDATDNHVSKMVIHETCTVPIMPAPLWGAHQ